MKYSTNRNISVILVDSRETLLRCTTVVDDGKLREEREMLPASVYHRESGICCHDTREQ